MSATSKKPNYIGILLVGGVAVGAYFLYQKFFNKSGSDSGALDFGSGGGAGGDLGGSEDPLSQIQDQMQPTPVANYGAGDPNPNYRQDVPQTVVDLFAAAPSYSSLGQPILPKTYAGQEIVYNTAPNSKTGEVATFKGGTTFGNSMLQGQQVGYVQVDSSKPLPTYTLVSQKSSGGGSSKSSSPTPAGVKAGTTFQNVTVKSSTGQTVTMSASSGFAAKLKAALASTSSSTSKAKKK